MRKILLKTIGRVGILLGFALLFVQCDGGLNGMEKPVPETDQFACLTTDYPTEALSVEEADALLFMREEEKLAHDVYVKLYEKWGAQVFSNIIQAEARHMEAVRVLIVKFGLTDPVAKNPVGVFQNTTLQEMYTTLVREGLVSPVAAYKTGAKIEDLDLYDLANITADPKVTNEAIEVVFAELARGSRNHLRAFARNLTRLGETYEPIYISAALYEEIINSPMEPGPGLCGVCQNQGPGNGDCNNCPGNCNGNGRRNGKS